MAETLSVSVAEAKKRFSELLGRVAFGGATVVVTKRGRPVARLVGPETPATPLSALEGWLDDAHPFLAQVDRIVAERNTRRSRVPARARGGRR